MPDLVYHTNCDHCGTKLGTVRYGAKYHSNACRQAAYRRRVNAAKDAKAAKRRKSAKKAAATRRKKPRSR